MHSCCIGVIERVELIAYRSRNHVRLRPFGFHVFVGREAAAGVPPILIRGANDFVWFEKR
jgi:hypothetical protein